MQLTAEPALIECLSDIGEPISRPTGAVLFKQGKPAVGVYVVQSGRIQLTVGDVQGVPIVVRRARKGSVLGVPGVVGEGAYSLTAEVLENADLLFISAKDVRKLMTEHPEQAISIVRLLSDEVRYLRQAIADPDKLPH